MNSQLEPLLRSAFHPLLPIRANGAAGHWTVAPVLGDAAVLTVDVASGWVSLRCPGPAGGAAASLAALAAQAAWRGCAKHVASNGPGKLRADVPLLVDTAGARDWFVRQLRDALLGVLGAAGPVPQASRLDQDAPAGTDTAEHLAGVCASGGWAASIRPDGSVFVELPLRAGQRTIVLEPRATHVRVALTLAVDDVGEAAAQCHGAAAQLLVRAAAAMPWARGFARLEDGHASAIGFECIVAMPCDDLALSAALDTLVSASELFGREAELLLAQPQVAAMYAHIHRGRRNGADADSIPPVASAAAGFSEAASAAVPPERRVP